MELVMSRRIYLSVSIAVAGLLSLACTKEGTQDTQTVDNSAQRHYVSLTAGTTSSEDAKGVNGSDSLSDGVSTKAIFPGNLKNPVTIYWQKDDKIGVVASGSESLYLLSVESRSANMQSATFGGEIEGKLGGYAVYPYDEGHKISGTTLTYHLPSEYTCNGIDTDWVANSDKIDASKSKANFALLAKITEGTDESSEESAETSSGTETSSSAATATFNHLGGLLCIKIDKMPSSTCTLTLTADKKICGDFNVDLTDSQPEIESDDASSTDNVVTVNTSGGIYNEPCVYYIPMPIGEYNVTVELSYGLIKGKENASCTATKKVEIERAKIKRITIKQSTMYKGGYKIIDGYKFIDLGLPSGLLWAETNVGAELPADFGDFYAWGETSVEDKYSGSYKYYNFDNYKYKDKEDDTIYTFTKYNSGGDMLTLDTSDDAAYTNWTTKCWTPTKEQVQELIDNTTVTLDATRENSRGTTITGAEFKSKTNDNSIFLPYNGEYDGLYHDWYSGGNDGNEYGRYLTNNLVPVVKKDWLVYTEYTYQQASILSFGWGAAMDNVCVYTNWRFYGMGVRPVANAN